MPLSPGHRHPNRRGGAAHAFTTRPFRAGLSQEKASSFLKRLRAEPRYLLAQNVSTCIDPLEVCLHRQTVQDTVHVFQHTIPTEGKPVTNQKNSGRCWIFSCLNVMRLPFMKKHNIEEFEFSQSYLFFWDKVERCYYFLQACVETAQRKEPVDGRLVQFLLSNPTNDGGQWDMLVNLIEKYGVIPKKSFPESHSSEASRRMNDILNHKLREYCLRLRNMVASDATKDELSEAMDTMIEEVRLDESEHKCGGIRRIFYRRKRPKWFVLRNTAPSRPVAMEDAVMSEERPT
ncbi:Bleomycin hydrolase [Liparis tanakae]|uniref:Bleomycin hydrolase n=1 Tax=Liparis tanakae TaxID=230148 RepID=A0A4Z2H425_9TELE|nr:Bleomycin hydrolase [Liparis tanakae]